MAATMLLVAAGPAFAADPKGGGTGIDETIPGAVTPEELGYTQEFADQKEAAFQASVSAIHNGGAAAVVLAPTASALGGWTPYHQKTRYNCLPAVGQSILHWDFGGYNVPTAAAKQGTAAHEASAITTGMHTTTDGTNDNNALAYVNSEYADNGSAWRYIATNNTVEADFKIRIQNQIGTSGHPLYVRVDLTNVNYAWHQTTQAQHATLAIAYTSSAANTTIDDPWTHNVTGGCSASWDNGTANVSCNWVNYSTHKYYLSKDVVRSGVQPMWF